MASHKPKGWFHLVMNGVDEGLHVYINGELERNGTTVDSVKVKAGDGKTVIGRTYTNKDKYYVSVMVDEMTFWNRNLTTQEIKAIYAMHK